VDKYSSTASLTEKYTSVTVVETVVSSNTAVSVLGLVLVVKLNPTGVKRDRFTRAPLRVVISPYRRSKAQLV